MTLADEAIDFGPATGDQPWTNVQVSQLVPGKFLPSRETSKAEFEELLASVKAMGVHTPILVQVRTNKIIAGERRWLAAKKAKRQIIPAVIYNVTDEQARLLALSENMHREDMSAMEEASAIARARAGGLTWAMVGQKLGMSDKAAARKAQLIYLIEPIQKALGNADSDWFDAPLAVLEYVAALPPETQQDVVEATRFEMRFEQASDAISFIEKHVLCRLDNARWDLRDDQLVAAAGACSECPSRSDREELLFETADAKEARCLRPDCFKAKATAHIVQVIRAVVAKGYDPVLVTDSPASRRELDVDGTTYRPVYGWEGRRVPNGKVQGAKRAINVDRGGTLSWFVLGKAATRPTKDNRPKQSAAEKRQRKRLVHVVEAIREELPAPDNYLKLGHGLGDLDAETQDRLMRLMRLTLLAFGNQGRCRDWESDLLGGSVPIENLQERFVELVGDQLASNLHYPNRNSDQLDMAFRVAGHLVEAFFVDTELQTKLVKRADEEIPEPAQTKALRQAEEAATPDVKRKKKPASKAKRKKVKRAKRTTATK
jgi:ParB/RepB/Spo0J family partition protein